jgi:Na+-translocating ferredoxin:NAD+ oxidoreductase RnfG subunit
MDKIKNQLAGVAALLGVIAAIGGGFVKYGEVMTKLDALEAQESVDHSASIAVLEQKIKGIEEQLVGQNEHGHTTMLINKKEIELLKNRIEELRISSGNPLATN